VSTPRSQHEQLQRLKTEIERVSELRAMEHLFALGQPGSLQHRRFRFELPTSAYDEGQLPQPGMQLDVTDSLVIVVAHDLGPGDHDDSWRLASEDVARMLIGLCASDLGQQLQVNGGGSSPSVNGHLIEQRVRLQYRYYLAIPEAS